MSVSSSAVTRWRVPGGRWKPSPGPSRRRWGSPRSAPTSRVTAPERTRIVSSLRRWADALPLHLRERREAHEAGWDGSPPEGAEPEERELDAEEALVRVRLVGDPRLEHPAVAARDEAHEVVA